MHYEWNTFVSNWNHGGISCDVHFAGHLRSNRTNVWSVKSNIRNVQSGGARGLELRTAGLHQGDKPPRTDWDRLCLREGEVGTSAKTWAFTHVTRDVIHPQRFDRFSKFSTLLTAVAHLIHVARSFAHSTQDECQGWHVCQPTEEELLKAKVCIVKSVQNECYSEELKCINSGSNILPSSSLWKLHPILDQNQLLRVGGWIE